MTEGSEPLRASGPQLLIVGQHPNGRTEYQEIEELHPDWPITKMVDKWLSKAGWPEGTAALTPFVNIIPIDVPISNDEIERWSWHVDNRFRQVMPDIVIPLGRLATNQSLRGGNWRYHFERDAGFMIQGNRLEQSDTGYIVVPFAHPSGRNRFLTSKQGKEAVRKQIQLLASLKENIQ